MNNSDSFYVSSETQHSFISSNLLLVAVFSSDLTKYKIPVQTSLEIFTKVHCCNASCFETMKNLSKKVSSHKKAAAVSTYLDLANQTIIIVKVKVTFGRR